MHQQIRVKLARANGRAGSNPMPAAANENDRSASKRGDLKRLLKTLRDADYSLQSAGGRNIEGDGEFVFSLDDEDHERADACRDLLVEQGYEVTGPMDVHLVRMAHKKGELLRALTRIQKPGQSVHEILVGAPDANGKVLAWITTVPADDGGAT
ncbi:MAG: hypothetical protein M3395_01680 [Chloroflexota bacterium]|nr:hypothetical protein [Chloroflexota bacterium]